MADRRVEVVNRRALVTVGGAALIAPLVATQVAAQTGPDRDAVQADREAIEAILSVAGEVQTGASVTHLASGSGAAVRSVQAKLRDTASILDVIPVSLHAAIRAGTHTGDLTSYFVTAIADYDTIYIPEGYYKVNIPNVKPGLTLSGAGVGQFSQSLFTYNGGTLLEAFDNTQPTITLDADAAGLNLSHVTIEKMCVASVGRVGDAISLKSTTGAKSITDFALRNISTRSALCGLRVDATLLWITFDHLTHDFCFDGCRIETEHFVNGLTAGVWAARRCHRHGFYWKKTDTSVSGFQAWIIELLSSDYNGDLSSTGVAQTGVMGVYINGFEGLEIGELVAEGNGLDQPSADGHGVLIEGPVNRGIKIPSAAIESNPIPFRWKGDIASGFLGVFYRLSSPTGQVPGIITATSAQGNDGTADSPKIHLGGPFAGEMRTTFDGNTGAYPTLPGMDYIPAQGTTLSFAHRNAVTINTSSASKTVTTLTLSRVGEIVTIFNAAGGTANTVTIVAALVPDGVAVSIPPTKAKAFIVMGFPHEGKLAEL